MTKYAKIKAEDYLDDNDIKLLDTALTFLDWNLTNYETYAINENEIIDAVQDISLYLFQNNINPRKLGILRKKLKNDDSWVNDL